MKLLLIFPMAVLLYGQIPSISQKIQAQGSVTVGMMAGYSNFLPAAEPPRSEAFIEPIISVQEIAEPRAGAGMKTGTRVRLPPFKQAVIHVWFLKDKISKQFGVMFRF